MPEQDTWTLEELWDDLRSWERELRANGYPDTTVNTYIGRSETFLRWLSGEWQPRGPRD